MMHGLQRGNTNSIVIIFLLFFYCFFVIAFDIAIDIEVVIAIEVLFLNHQSTTCMPTGRSVLRKAPPEGTRG